MLFQTIGLFFIYLFLQGNNIAGIFYKNKLRTWIPFSNKENIIIYSNHTPSPAILFSPMAVFAPTNDTIQRDNAYIHLTTKRPHVLFGLFLD